MRKISIFFFCLFLSFAANAEQLDNEIIYRAAFGSAQDVRLLIDRGANPSARNSIGQPLIVIAASRSDDEAAKVVKSLLESGVNVNSTTQKGETPILVATRSGTAETIKILLGFLPSMKVKDSAGNDLKKIAEDRQDKKIIKLIETAITDEEKRMADHQTGDQLKKLIKEYSFYTCANQYLNYYVASGQNKNIDSIAFNRIIAENQKKILSSKKELRQFFKVIAPELDRISSETRAAIVSELDGIGTVEARTVAGVGRDADLSSRCNKIANLWSVSKIKTKK